MHVFLHKCPILVEATGLESDWHMLKAFISKRFSDYSPIVSQIIFFFVIARRVNDCTHLLHPFKEIAAFLLGITAKSIFVSVRLRFF